MKEKNTNNCSSTIHLPHQSSCFGTRMACKPNSHGFFGYFEYYIYIIDSVWQGLLPQARSSDFSLKKRKGHTNIILTVLTTYCCVAMAGLTKSGLGPPGSHIAELFRKHAVAYHGSPEESRAHFLMWGEEYLEQVSQSSCHIIQLV